MTFGDGNRRHSRGWFLLAAMILAFGPGAAGCGDDDNGNGGLDAGDAGLDDATVDSTVQMDSAIDAYVEPNIGPPGEFVEHIHVDVLTRTYVLFVPQSAVDAMQNGPVPLLIGLHGAGDNGQNFIHATQLTNLATTNSSVVVGPYGYNAGWFVQQNEGWPGTDGNPSSLENDTAFMLAIIDETNAEYYIDNHRIYAVGHSRGAGFTALLAITSGQMDTFLGAYQSPFGAYGINAGYDPTQGSINPATATPKRPVWIIHGTADSVVQLSWGQSLYDDLNAAGWTATFTSVTNGPHTWLWRSTYGQTNQDLWDFFMDNPSP